MFCTLINMRIAVDTALRNDNETEWDIESAIATYNVEGWGEGYFTVNSSGNVEARPLKKMAVPSICWKSSTKRVPETSVFRC
jgi:Arginine decarboxylase (spermidine biosynthesis)